MRIAKYIHWPGAVIYLSLLAVSCSKDSPTTSNTDSGYRAVINSGGSFPGAEDKNEVVAADTVAETIGNEQYFCTTTRYSVVETPESFPTFDPNAEVIYPGNLLQGSTLSQATPNPVPVKRAGGTIVMTILNGSPSVSRTIPVVDLGHVSQAQNEIIAEASNTIPARFYFTMESVSSREQLALALDVNVSNLTGDFGASLAFSQDKQYNRFVVKLVQSYFTMAFQLPTSIDEIFAPDASPTELARYIGPGNPGAFISSVTYGRIFYLLIESTESHQALEASVDASFRAAVSSGQIGVDAKYVRDLENVKIKAFAMGGDAASAISSITTDFETLKTFLAQGGSINTGVALSYVVRSLANPSQIVKIGLATEYDVTQCVLISESVPNPIFWYRVDDPKYYVTGAGANSRYVARLKNAFGDANLDALPTAKTFGAELSPNALSGGRLPVLKFVGAHSLHDGKFQYPGVKFANSDYTMFAVVKLPALAISYPEYFMFGTSTTELSNLSIGFRDNIRWTMSHQNHTMDAASPYPLDRWNVVTVRFSMTEGMSIYVNNSPVPAGADGFKRNALISYLSARIGTQNGNEVLMAEIRAYGHAVTADERNVIVNSLLTKYAL